MKLSFDLPATPWPALCTALGATIGNAQFAQAGVWQLQHVRIDLPLALAQVPPNAHQNLRTWLNHQGLTYLITGASRTCIAVSLEFSKYP